MRNLLITKIILFGAIALVLTAVLIMAIMHGGIGIDMNFLYEHESYKTVFSGVIDAKEIENINIDWTSGSVEVKPTDNDEIYIVQKSRYDLDETEVLQLVQEGNSIEIKEGKRKVGFIFFGFGLQSSTLEVYLPKKEYNDLYFKNTSGKVDVEGVFAKTVNLKSTSGIVDTQNINADQLDINVTSGRVLVEDIKVNVLNTKTTSGLIDIEGEIKEITSNTTSGKISIIDTIMPKKLDANLTSGKIDISIPENEGFIVKSKITSRNIFK